MHSSVVQKLSCGASGFLGSLLCGLSLWSLGINYAVAQTNIPSCQPPNAGEFVLLVVSPTKDNQSQLKRVLPKETKTSICRYLKDVVTRIGGFSSIEDANRWARYVRDSAGLSAIIATKPSEKPEPQAVSFKPQRLGEGYAVLVDYQNRPEMAGELQRVVNGDIGFVSYGQRPFLMAVYTTNRDDAHKTLQKLSDRGYFAILVDSRKVTLLRSVVKL
ncbi:hypothetical protein [Calothrix sp. 336/3]|uniref:hypothetical protein n=1 Tax=Calothrix sp. 336/3 TaxID=1337936 RepID=UPI0004E29E0A|nr:hypothetical protein [Calothrix sp. 336/3]AKG19920.1 hypothetical protein IJ00_00040 [Calothrix sp. 336/3]